MQGTMTKTFHIANEMEDYNIAFQIEFDPKNPLFGIVKGNAQGTYTFENDVFCVEFDGLNGKGTSGGWNNSSMQIGVSETVFLQFLQSSSSEMSSRVIVKSRQLYNRPISAVMMLIEEKQ